MSILLRNTATAAANVLSVAAAQHHGECASGSYFNGRAACVAEGGLPWQCRDNITASQLYDVTEWIIREYERKH
eukprot:m.710135 g.710135  ORF g.710135 m.710135 type:complete len:74 (+) comp22950_c0_seq9:1255-1476(+)